MIFPTKKVAKFSPFFFSISRGGAGACPGIRKRGGPKSESLFFFFFFFAFQFFRGGGPAQTLAEKKKYYIFD